VIPYDNRFNFTNRMPVMNTMLVQPDGKDPHRRLRPGQQLLPPISDFFLARLGTDGRPDSSFGTDSTVVTSFPGNEQESPHWPSIRQETFMPRGLTSN
jgi:hypothetical protein